MRRQKDQFFKSHPNSPLTAEQKTTFEGLAYYDYNPGLDLTVTVTPFDEQKNVLVQTTTGDAREYLRYGEFTFTVDGEERDA